MEIWNAVSLDRLIGIAITAIILVLFSLLFLFAEMPDFEKIMAEEDSTDEEYIRQMGPEVPADIALKVRRIVSYTGGFDAEYIWPDTKLIDVLE